MKIPSVDSGECGGSIGTTLAVPTPHRPGKGAEGKENIASAPQIIKPSEERAGGNKTSDTAAVAGAGDTALRTTGPVSG